MKNEQFSMIIFRMFDIKIQLYEVTYSIVFDFNN